MRTSKTFIFLLEIISLLSFINSFSFFVVESAKEKENPPSKAGILTFTINGRISEGFDTNKLFIIKTDIYEDNNLLSNKNAECIIPRAPQADFGDTINANCEIDLQSFPKANKIKFKDFSSNDDKLEINDKKNYVLDNSLSFTQKLDNAKPDLEFIASNIKSLSCLGNKFIFGLEGEINKYWVDKFNFNITLNDQNGIIAECKCPNIYFNSDVMINCTITVLNDNNYIDSLKRGIEIKENLYNVINSKSEKKLFKLKIKNDKDKIELREIKCDPNSNNNNEQRERDRSDNEEYNRKSNRGYQYDNDKKDDSYYGQYNYEREREEERKRQREREEREREEEKKKRDQDNLAEFLRQRQQEREEIERRNRYSGNENNNYNNNNYNNYNNYNTYNNNYNNNNNNNQRNNENDDTIDYNSNVKLIHLQVRYSYGFLYYMFYALTPVSLGHKIKARFSITKYNYNSGYNDQENQYIFLKTEEEVNPNERNIILEYVARYDCQDCKKIILDRNSVQGAKIFNIPEDPYALDAVYTNQNNYLTKNKMQNPPLYISESVYNQNCMITLSGNFFNRNKFFASKFPLKLISVGYYGNNRNVTIFCGLNDRGIFSCPINENLNNFEYKLEPLIIDQKENIIIDNSYVAKEGMTNHVNCLYGNKIEINANNNNLLNNNNDKQNESGNEPFFTWKRIIFGIIILIILYYAISKCCCQKEEEYPEEYNSRWRVSSSNYGGETYGLRNKW